jgi:hypothetical protein
MPFTQSHQLAAALSLMVCPLFAAQAAPPPARIQVPPLTISVFNDARVPPNALAAAQEQASQIFRRAGLEVVWLRCPATNSSSTVRCADSEFPRHLHVRILPNSRGLSEDTVGVSFLSEDGTGCYADVFYESALRLHFQHGLDLGTFLGRAVAHEIGHLLLGTNSHSEGGIMRARWSRAEAVSSPQDGFSFSELESRQMREKFHAH